MKDLLRRAVGFIDEQRRAGRTTCVHCMIGVNRSGADPGPSPTRP